MPVLPAVYLTLSQLKKKGTDEMVLPSANLLLYSGVMMNGRVSSRSS